MLGEERGNAVVVAFDDRQQNRELFDQAHQFQ